VNRLDIVETREAIAVEYAPGTTEEVELHDGSTLRLAKLSADYDPYDRIGAMTYLQARAAAGELVTGLIYMDRGARDMHANLNTVSEPLNRLSEKELCPGAAGLNAFNAAHR
jgi:2-oxoglutarate ferredoxin oxidoreductase subunit beta